PIKPAISSHSTQHSSVRTNTSMDPRLPSTAEVLEELVGALRTSLTPVTTPSSASVSPMALPASYAGDAAVCGGFLLQVDLFLEVQPQKFTTERSKVAFLISLLNGNTAIINSYDAFKNNFKEVFGSTTGELSVSDQHLRLRQGSSTTREYTLQFHTLAATTSTQPTSSPGAPSRDDSGKAARATSVTPLAPNLLRRAAQKGRRTFPPPSVRPFWAQYMKYRALDT
uniref:Retrotransposon gag domain-containing protein n=1 Tax=Sinocyclocheilus anshuiensis TaxID=1608454 RepID=A0A671MZF2_9TELE